MTENLNKKSEERLKKLKQDLEVFQRERYSAVQYAEKMIAAIMQTEGAINVLQELISEESEMNERSGE